jgi:hypothetical protein
MSSVVQMDSAQFTDGSDYGTQTFVESGFGFKNVKAGDAIVVLVRTEYADNHVLSITDNYGNTYHQVPGARVASAASVQTVDIWYAENVAAVSDPPTALSLTITRDGTLAAWGAALYDVTGISGAPVAVGTVVDENGSATIDGPALDGGSEALFIAALGNFAAHNSTATHVASPWSFFTSITGYEPDGLGSGWLISSGLQKPHFTLWVVSTSVISAVAFHATPPDPPDPMELPVLGSVPELVVPLQAPTTHSSAR